MPTRYKCGHSHDTPFLGFMRHRNSNELCHDCAAWAGESSEMRGIDVLRWLWKVILAVLFIAYLIGWHARFLDY
jgi:hypothetical protein